LNTLQEKVHSNSNVKNRFLGEKMIEEKKLTEIFTSSGVFHETAQLEEYGGDTSFVNRIQPEYVVKPRNTEEIMSLVKLANATQTPLVPVSSGSPHFRGDTVPGIGGAIVVDLSAMNKVIRADRTNRVIMFEPGVTFGDLIAAAGAVGLRLNMPLMPRSTKSVVGSLLEREPVILPKYHWDIADPLCDVEIVLGNGDLFRTGAAAGPGTLEEQWEVGGAQKEAAGPSSNSWYRLIQGSQGCMGIVTWASARCEILPKKEDPYFAGSNDLSNLLEMVHWLVRLRLVNECLVLNNANVAMMLAKAGKQDYFNLRSTLPKWILFYNVAAYDYFPEKRIAGQTADIAELAQKFGLEPGKTLNTVSANNFLQAVRSVSSEPYWKIRQRGASQDVFCLSNFQKITPLVDTMVKVADMRGYPSGDMGIYIQPVVQGVNYHVEFSLFYNPKLALESDQVKNLARTATKELLATGGFFSRPYGENTAMIMNRDAISVEALKKVKGILDPHKIMNPGKLCF
jgi:FAD/FMN-containing dehydrogenase